ncbi:MAG: hypothetical protein IJP01_04575 [Oscillospiraceae bacterium]|nr:hypothetical protein [Oscillospiraceae bacterium]
MAAGVGAGWLQRQLAACPRRGSEHFAGRGARAKRGIGCTRSGAGAAASALASVPLVGKIAAGAVLAAGLIAGGVGIAMGGAKSEPLPTFDYWGNSWVQDGVTCWELLDLDEDGSARYVFIREENGALLSRSEQLGSWSGEEGDMVLSMTGDPEVTHERSGSDSIAAVISMQAGKTEFSASQLRLTDSEDSSYYRIFFPVGSDSLPLLPVVDSEGSVVFVASESFAQQIGCDSTAAGDSAGFGDTTYTADMSFEEKLAYTESLMGEPGSAAWVDVSDLWLDFWCRKYSGYWNNVTDPYFFGIYSDEQGWHFESGMWDTDMWSRAVLTGLHVGWQGDIAAVKLVGVVPAVAPSEYDPDGQPERTIELVFEMDLSQGVPTTAYLIGNGGSAAYAYSGESMSEAYSNYTP